MTYVHYDPRWDDVVDLLIRDREFSKTGYFGVTVVEPPGLGDCQSWVFEQLGLPQFAHGILSLADLTEAGFREVSKPSPRDLAVYLPGMDHYGMYHEDNRIKSKLGIGGAVCIHPLSAFAGNRTPKFFSRSVSE